MRASGERKRMQQKKRPLQYLLKIEHQPTLICERLNQSDTGISAYRPSLSCLGETRAARTTHVLSRQRRKHARAYP